MILLSLLKYLQDNGHGEIGTDLWWGKMGLDQKGLYITELGAPQARGEKRNMMYQLFSRADNDVKAYKQLESVRELLASSYDVCTLPEVIDNGGVLSEGYNGVTIMKPSTISNDGLDAQGRTMYSIIGTIYY